MKMILLLGVVFVLGFHPLVMIFMMIMIVLLYSFILFYEMGNYWFGYMLMLVMLSGVLVLFTYMASMVPNEAFEMNSLIFILMYFYFMIIYLDFYGLSVDFSYLSLLMWELSFSFFNIFMVGFLFYIMYMVVDISEMIFGPFRVYKSAWLKG